jgi:hypothetical protein
VVLAVLTRLKQVCNHPAQFLGDGSALPGRSGKLDRLGEMLEEALSVGDRALIFTQFAEMGHMLRAHLQSLFGVEGALSARRHAPKAARRMVARFQQEDDGPPLFLLSLKAGGTGLNLTAANHVFHFDRWWNPAVEEPGHRPRLSHRPDARCAGAQVSVRRHAGGADRRADREQKGLGRQRRRRGGLADRAEHRRAARPDERLRRE